MWGVKLKATHEKPRKANKHGLMFDMSDMFDKNSWTQTTMW